MILIIQTIETVPNKLELIIFKELLLIPVTESLHIFTKFPISIEA